MNKYFQFPLGTHPALLALLVKCVAAAVTNLFQKFPNTLGTLILLHNGSGGGILTERKAALPRLGGNKGRDCGKSKNKEGFRWGRRQMGAKQSFQSPGEHLQYRLM